MIERTIIDIIESKICDKNLFICDIKVKNNIVYDVWCRGKVSPNFLACISFNNSSIKLEFEDMSYRYDLDDGDFIQKVVDIILKYNERFY